MQVTAHAQRPTYKTATQMPIQVPDTDVQSHKSGSRLWWLYLARPSPSRMVRALQTLTDTLTGQISI